MKNRSARGVLAYLLHAEDSSGEGQTMAGAASGPGSDLLALVKTGLWMVIALVFAYGLSRLSDAQKLL